MILRGSYAHAPWPQGDTVRVRLHASKRHAHDASALCSPAVMMARPLRLHVEHHAPLLPLGAQEAGSSPAAGVQGPAPAQVVKCAWTTPFHLGQSWACVCASLRASGSSAACTGCMHAAAYLVRTCAPPAS